MKRLGALISIGFLASASTSATATTFGLRVGSCPSALSFSLTGTWRSAYLDEDTANALRVNPNRRAIVAGVFLNDALPGSSISVMSLGAIEPEQGRLSEDDFKQLVDLALTQMSNMDPKVRAQLDDQIRERADGAGIEMTD